MSAGIFSDSLLLFYRAVHIPFRGENRSTVREYRAQSQCHTIFSISQASCSSIGFELLAYDCLAILYFPHFLPRQSLLLLKIVHYL
jgi:hypothetical protein